MTYWKEASFLLVEYWNFVIKPNLGLLFNMQWQCKSECFKFRLDFLQFRLFKNFKKLLQVLRILGISVLGGVN